MKEFIARELDAARQRSLDLLAPLPDTELRRLHSPLMSPLVWDLAHVGNYEDLWLVRGVGGEAVGANLDDIYDAFRHARRERPALALLGPAEARAYVASVRGRALDLLDAVELRADAPLVAGGFVYGMVVQHEHQHGETMLATLQLAGDRVYRPATAPLPAGGPVGPAEVTVPAGPFVLGTSTDPWAYDNERPAVAVETAAFCIGTAPVTNADYAAFIDAGGYAHPDWWHPDGWAWRAGVGAEHPGFWRREGPASWSHVRRGQREDLAPDQPVQHVCWYEADAYARSRGRRLPTEIEWEKAASWDQATGRKRRFPWGDDPPGPQHANLGQRHGGPAPVGAYPAGASPAGCH
ncbi:MAG: SUMF1/EgtB/PvdO family nonheme iron enzyme, partial [Acidimicrobiales bacterium]